LTIFRWEWTAYLGCLNPEVEPDPPVIKFSFRRDALSRIRIAACGAPGGMAQFTVRDNRVGIPAASTPSSRP
jgi:hypothetical protein